MRKHLKNKRAQSTAEYAVLLGLVVGAIVTMQVYVRRSINAKIADASDFLTQQGGAVSNWGTGNADIGTRSQYEPYYLYREQQQSTSRDRAEKEVTAGGAATSTIGKTVEQTSVVQYKQAPDQTTNNQ
jgi:Flp pilus assembly pilin Flp